MLSHESSLNRGATGFDPAPECAALSAEFTYLFVIRYRECSSMVKLIIEPKKGKGTEIDYIVTYHDQKSDNQFMVTTTDNLAEALQRLRETLESEVQLMQQQK